MSRQRYVGVPIPLWYPIRDDGTLDPDRPLGPDPGQLPVDPMIDTPPGCQPGQRGEAGGFAREAGETTEELDRAFLQDLGSVCARATAALEDFDHAAALEEAERSFCDGLTDNYLELVKGRLRTGGPGAASAAYTLRTGLRIFSRLFAPFLPFVTDEIWSWAAAGETGHASVHRALWPGSEDFAAVPPADDAGSFAAAVAAIAAVRRHKTEAKVSVVAAVARLTVAGAPEDVARARRVAEDIRVAARAREMELIPDPTLEPGTFVVRGAVFG